MPSGPRHSAGVKHQHAGQPHTSVGPQDWVEVVCGPSSGTLSHVQLCAKGARAVDAVDVRVVRGRGFVHVHEPAVAGNLGFLRLQLRLEDELVGSLLLVGADDVDVLVVAHGVNLPCGA